MISSYRVSWRFNGLECSYLFASGINPPTAASASAISPMSSPSISLINDFSSLSDSGPPISPLDLALINFFHLPTKFSARIDLGIGSEEVLAKEGRKEY